MKIQKSKLGLSVLSLVMGLVLLFSTVALAQSEDLVKNSVFTKVRNSGVLKVGINPGYAPFEMINQQGDLIGFDVDIAKILANKLGVELKLVKVGWQGIIPGLKTGKYDIIICGLTRKIERTLEVSFTDPYFSTGQMVLINEEKMPNVKSYSDLNNDDTTITVMQGTSGHMSAKNNLPKANLKNMTSREEAALLVAQGRADAFIFDEPLIKYYLAKYPEKTYTIEDEYLSSENLAFAVRWGDPMWRTWLNYFIHQFKNVFQIGSEEVKKYDIDPKFKGRPLYEGLYDKWFNDWMAEAKSMG